MENKNIIVTIGSLNYISYVRALFKSIRQHHGIELNLLFVLADEIEGRINPLNEDFEILEAKKLRIDDYLKIAFKYNILEFNTAIKPFVLKYLIDKNFEKIIYLDPDIYLFDRLDKILILLESKSILLTPHITTPIFDSYRPSEQDFLKTGIFNLGFIAISNNFNTIKFLEWWCNKCKDLCFNESETGLFVDQKWINLVPCLFDSVHIMIDIRFNMAYWNLHERILDGFNVNKSGRLVFFHFSGFCIENINCISKYQDRFSLDSRPDLCLLFNYYKNELINFDYYNTFNYHYKYSIFNNGVVIDDLHRRLFIDCQSNYTDPFMATGESFYKKLVKNRLISSSIFKNDLHSLYSEKSYYVNKLLLFVKTILGIKKYIILLKYLGWVSTLRRQNFLIKK